MSGDNAEMLKSYFKNISKEQLELFAELGTCYAYWNERVNLISRKDIDNLFYKHILHSLFISRFLTFKAGTRILDAGTGGGLPGLPLAIMFPDCDFVLVDARAKKINAVSTMIEKLLLSNAHAIHGRIEDLQGQFEFIISRAVAPVEKLMKWSAHLTSEQENNAIPNGWIFLKGGDLTQELKSANVSGLAETYLLNDWIPLDDYDDKKLVYIPF